MTKTIGVFSFLFALLLVASATVFLCSFDFSSSGNVLYPTGVVARAAHEKQSGVVYVSGAVEHSGFYTFEEGDTYFDVLSRAGLSKFFYFPDFTDEMPLTTKSVYVDYVENGARSFCQNVNSDYVTSEQNDALSQEVKNALSSYVSLNGKITNDEQLKAALGDLFDNWFYKLLIWEDDYEKID